MTIGNLFKTTTSGTAPLDASAGDTKKALVSDFLTLQSLSNFSVMTGAGTAVWNALKLLDHKLFSGAWVAFAFAFLFGVVSILTSLSGLKRANEKKLTVGDVAAAVFIALINTLILASAIVGVSATTRSTP